jgi:signal transduction histidine kinase
MPAASKELAREYSSVLRAYLAGDDEACLHRVYQLSRSALDDGHGILTMADLHHKAMANALKGIGPSAERERVSRLGHALFLEALSPFEMSQRQSRDACHALRRVNETLEGEVRRIAYALHDEAAQLIVSAVLAVDEVASGLPPQSGTSLDKIRSPLQDCASALRRLSHEMRPPALDELGLRPALEFLASSVSRRLGIPITVDGSTDERPPPSVEVALYRIVQEALANVVKHARASRVLITLRQRGSVMTCSVRDDGVGFDLGLETALEKPSSGLGLSILRERIDALGGTHRVVTGRGRGTELTVTVPVGGSDGDSSPAR